MNAVDVATLGKSGWNRPDPESIISFAVLFLLFTLAGYAIHAHIRAGRLSQWATGIVGLCFTIAIGFGFAIGLWVVDRLGLYEPYAVPPAWVVEREKAESRSNVTEPVSTFTIEQPRQVPTHTPGE